jgi:hypothetical protein
MGVRTKILALDEPVLDSLADALARLLLVAVVGRAVEEAVARLDRVVHGLEASSALGSSVAESAHVLQRKTTWSLSRDRS